MFEATKKLVLAIAVLWCGPVAAQTITREQAAQAVTETERLVREKYVFPEMRDKIAARLREGRASGRYSVTNAEELGSRVTEDLRAASNDKHMSLRWDPQWYEAAVKTPGPPGPAAGEEFWARMARLRNHGIHEVKNLDGNVRYLRLSSFFWMPDVSGRRIDAAMELLKDGDAVIIDLSGNGGGSTASVLYFISHFLPANDDRLLMTFLDGDSSFQSTALSYLPAGRIKAPLFVITGENTVSAAEEFTYHVKHFKLGTLVGGRTAGAANNNALLPVAPGFQASISFGRPVHPVTKTNWEGVGIEPDVPAAPEKALQTAHLKALEAIAAAAPEAERAIAQWRVDHHRAVLNPYRASAADQRNYVGTYGERRVWLEGATLMWQREGRPRSKLLPFAKDVYALETDPSVRVRFLGSPKGRSRAVEMVYDNGETLRLERTR
jgi:hypothetical protein